MSLNLPSQEEPQLCRCRALYLGTNIFKTKSRKVDESKLSLSLLQNTISERYPIDGSNFAKGIETWLSIYPSGLQMEHSSLNDSYTISALFYYPIKSLVYCGALRYISENISNKFRLFEPLDSEIAQTEENTKNPPLFVVFLKGVDPTTKARIIECSIFVIGKKTTAMRLVESSQQAFNMSRLSTDSFYSKYGNIPAVFCSKDEIKPDHKTNRVSVKKYDSNGYFYATKSTSIDIWQLVDDIYTPPKASSHNHQHYSEDSNAMKQIDPYENTDNLISVEKLIDPQTGQNIYVRYLNENSHDVSQSNKLMYDVPDLVYDDKLDYNGMMDNQQILVRQEKTPSPIIVEKYIKKKAPQVIIKEIHVQEPAPPPIKLVQKMENSQIPVYSHKKPIEHHQQHQQQQQYHHQQQQYQQQQQQQKLKQQPSYYKQPNSVQTLRKPLYNRVGQQLYSGVENFHKINNQHVQQPPPPKLKVTAQPPDPYQSNKLPNPYNFTRPTPHSVQATNSSTYHHYNSTNKYASINPNHVNQHSSLNKSRYHIENDIRAQQQNLTKQSSANIGYSTESYRNKLPAKQQKPSEYRNTYDLIENVESLIEKSKNDKSVSNSKGRKIYVIHQNDSKTKSTDQKYNRKIIVIDEPRLSDNDSSDQKQQQQQQQIAVKKKPNESMDNSDVNYFSNIDKKQPIKRGDKPYYSHR